ncbi:unnamed protein product (macronuclear) [Paramecium tetraurelia]|uniref:Protein kinase domain-containing protein n=1 Tax=Paramecium tetraurelia TaxID=5888 RepID=A0DNW0_PARTE|nr:uncharacterized protein GSPATT00018923001 [Paramecium tetraurelia]CAK84727.1 unnamed protein product [Paramecium tetraurelia]|eukprot:XP_001452124.1 hypothetical protein (macronuclear) [Paramecium tetraurelia strain d4-2]
MQIANYQIELPISLDYSYQQLYRGFDQSKQSHYINIFPKSELDSKMYESISKKIQCYPYIKDAFEDDNNLIISYSNSNAWIKMPSKITNDQFNAYLKQLYDLYSLDILGFYDFNPDYLYINQNTVFITDYGLKYYLHQIKYQQLYNNNYQQNQLIKTWMFGSLLYCMTTGTKDPSFLIKSNQQQINFHIEYNCRQNNISEDNINFIKILLRPDHDIRPAFDQLANLPKLQDRQFVKLHSQPSSNHDKHRVIKKINQHDDQIPKSPNKQTQQQFVFSRHHSKVKLALKSNLIYASQKQIKNSKLNQYQLASQLIKSKVTHKHGQVIKNISTTKSFYTQNNVQNQTALNEQSRQNPRINQKNLSINIDVVKPSRTTSVNTKSLDQQSVAETNPLPIKSIQENKFEFKQKPRKNQINSFEQNFYFREEDDKSDISF